MVPHDTEGADDDEEIPLPRKRRFTDQPTSLAKNVGLSIMVVGLATSLFSAGYNWRSVSIIETRQVAIEDQFVRKDVQGEQLQILRYQVSELARQIDELRTEVRLLRRKE